MIVGGVGAPSTMLGKGWGRGSWGRGWAARGRGGIAGITRRTFVSEPSLVEGHMHDFEYSRVCVSLCVVAGGSFLCVCDVLFISVY